jgi:ubiquinone/menaquinone biosynthesis C-methylase UbiE
MKEVNKEVFWKDRLKHAVDTGNLHHSVYISTNKLWDDILKEHLVIIKKEIPTNAKVLDAGCGYGRMAKYFSDYTGVDFSPDFINKAKELNQDKNFIVSKLESLPFKDNEFDVGFMISVKAMIINNLGTEAWLPMEKELKRVCKKFIIMEYGVSDEFAKCDADKYEIL